jgi:hypothetical protein
MIQSAWDAPAGKETKHHIQVIGVGHQILSTFWRPENGTGTVII